MTEIETQKISHQSAGLPESNRARLLARSTITGDATVNPGYNELLREAVLVRYN
jgi:hypothetical protein